MANRVSSRELVGRAEELALLVDLVARAAVGEGAAVLVAGEAGVGKSRLVGELVRRARAAGSLVLMGECVDLAEAELSYAPIVGALRGLVRDRNEPELVPRCGIRPSTRATKPVTSHASRTPAGGWPRRCSTMAIASELDRYSWKPSALLESSAISRSCGNYTRSLDAPAFRSGARTTRPTMTLVTENSA